MFVEIDKLKSEYISGAVEYEELQGVDVELIEELVDIKKKLSEVEESSGMGLEALFSLVLGSRVGLGGIGKIREPSIGDTGKPGFWEGFEIVSDFGYRKQPTAGATTMHLGIDIGCPEGTPVYAPVDCIITYSGYNAGYGHQIKGSYGNRAFMYAHLSVRYVSTGPCVKGPSIS